MRKTFSLIVALLVFPCAALANDETIVFIGLPTSLSFASTEGAERVPLEGEDSLDKRIVIVKRDGKYYWRSRQDKELVYFMSGAFHIFVAPTSGYIKIMETKFIQPLSEESLPPFMYFESMSQWLDTYTYHGVGQDLKL